MSEQPYWEDIDIGFEIPPLVKQPTIEQMVRWAGASGDFYPIHYNMDRAMANSLPGLTVHGALKSAWLGQMLTDWIGENGRIKSYGCTYHRMDFPGDILICRGNVAEKYTEGNEWLVTCDIWIDNSRGEKTTSGTASVVILSRGTTTG